LLPCEGSYFQIASYASISTEDDIQFTKRLVKDVGVAAIPLSPFYADAKQTQCIRFCFAKEEDTLKKAVERLQKL
jgi:methionine aminotransferase